MTADRPSGYKIMRAMSRVDQLRAMLGEDPDPQLLIDTIEGQSDALDVLDALTEALMADELLAGAASERAQRLRERAGKIRATVLAILQEKLGVERVERPLYTASVGHTQKALVTDEEALSPAYFRSSVDMRKVLADLKKGPVAGASLANTEPHLIITKR